jgi:hypothetical protein
MYLNLHSQDGQLFLELIRLVQYLWSVEQFVVWLLLLVQQVEELRMYK